MSNSSKKITIMRGLPGCGKSTWHKKNRPNASVCSADYYFIGSDKLYKFDKNKITEAHNWCLRMFLKDISENKPLIVVDNTNISAWEISPYYRIGETFGYEMEIIHITVPPEVCYRRNIRNVPLDSIFRMNRRVDNLPPWWNVKKIEEVYEYILVTKKGRINVAIFSSRDKAEIALTEWTAYGHSQQFTPDDFEIVERVRVEDGILE